MGKKHLPRELPSRDGCPGVGEMLTVHPAASCTPLWGLWVSGQNGEKPCAQEAELGQKQPPKLPSARVKAHPRKEKRAGIGAG